MSKFLVGQYDSTINKRGEEKDIGLFTQRQTMRYHLPDGQLSLVLRPDGPTYLQLFDECLVDEW